MSPVQLVSVGDLDSLHGVVMVVELEEDVPLCVALLVQRIVLVYELPELKVDLTDHVLQLLNALGAHAGDSVHNDDTEEKYS